MSNRPPGHGTLAVTEATMGNFDPSIKEGQLDGPPRSQPRENQGSSQAFDIHRQQVSTTYSENPLNYRNLGGLNESTSAAAESRGTPPGGRRQIAARVLEALAQVRAPDMARNEADRESCADLVRKLAELELKLQERGAAYRSLKPALAEVEAGLRSWHHGC
jgi:hypothetical protein